MRSVPHWVLMVLLGGCVFDSAGGSGMPMLGHDDAAVEETDGEPSRVPLDEPVPDTTASPESSTSGGGDEHDSGGDDPTETDGIDDGGPGDGDDAGSSGGSSVQCPAELFTLVWIDDAQLESPMNLATVTGAATEPNIGVSTVADAGKATFSLTLPCAGEYFVWGLVWDYLPGPWLDPDPDSFHVGTGADEFVWRYGCKTTEAFSWQPLERLQSQPCTVQPIALVAPAPGTYALTLRNREAGVGSMVAGIAALAVSTDPDADPYLLYAP
jgi:hypothetical protein